MVAWVMPAPSSSRTASVKSTLMGLAPFTVFRSIIRVVIAATLPSSPVMMPSPLSGWMLTRSSRSSRLDSARRIVPEGVPSLFQISKASPSSTPAISLPANHSRPSEKAVRLFVARPPADTRTVPTSVPSLFHNSLTRVPGSAEKKTSLPTTVRSVGFEPTNGNGAISRTRVGSKVGSVRSILNSSRPEAPAFAVKKRVLPDTVKSAGDELLLPK